MLRALNSALRLEEAWSQAPTEKRVVLSQLNPGYRWGNVCMGDAEQRLEQITTNNSLLNGNGATQQR